MSGSWSGFGEELDEFAVRFENGEQEIRLQDLSFKSRFGQLNANSHLLNWRTDAEFELDGTIGGLVVSSVVANPNLQSISSPLSGSVKLATSGTDWQALTGNLRGEISLQTAADTPPDDAIRIDLAVKQAGSGIEARLDEFTLGKSDLAGTGSFVPGQVPVIRVTATSNYLDLLTLRGRFWMDSGIWNASAAASARRSRLRRSEGCRSRRGRSDSKCLQCAFRYPWLAAEGVFRWCCSGLRTILQ